MEPMLYAVRQRQHFAHVEEAAFAYEKDLPQVTGQHKHWCVICEHYVLGPNYDQRFQDVVVSSPCVFGALMIVQIAQYTCICSHRGSPNLFLLILAFCARLSKHYSYLSDGDLWCKCEECILISRAVCTAARRTIHRLRLCKKIPTDLPGKTVPLSLFNDNDGYSSLW